MAMLRRISVVNLALCVGGLSHAAVLNDNRLISRERTFAYGAWLSGFLGARLLENMESLSSPLMRRAQARRSVDQNKKGQWPFCFGARERT